MPRRSRSAVSSGAGLLVEPQPLGAQLRRRHGRQRSQLVVERQPSGGGDQVGGGAVARCLVDAVALLAQAGERRPRRVRQPPGGRDEFGQRRTVARWSRSITSAILVIRASGAAGVRTTGTGTGRPTAVRPASVMTRPMD